MENCVNQQYIGKYIPAPSSTGTLSGRLAWVGGHGMLWQVCQNGGIIGTNC